jgi:hypothetical protein
MPDPTYRQLQAKGAGFGDILMNDVPLGSVAEPASNWPPIRTGRSKHKMQAKDPEIQKRGRPNAD